LSFLSQFLKFSTMTSFCCGEVRAKTICGLREGRGREEKGREGRRRGGRGGAGRRRGG
jgi:hypothetical protein